MKNNPRDLERYKIREKIGSGSYGIVYKGEDRLTGMIVALKYISKK
jgi:serine/threonine protein kinase